MKDTELQSLITKLLNGQSIPWPYTGAENYTHKFVDQAQRDGVLCLLEKHGQQLKTDGWPDSIHKAVAIASKTAQTIQHYRQIKITQLFELFDSEGIRTLVFKGAANAYLLYDKPLHRQHADIDLLIQEHQFKRVKRLLTEMGFSFEPTQPTRYGPFQSSAKLNEAGQAPLVLDIHWRVNNRPVLADCLGFDELYKRAINLNEYGHSAKAAGLSHALLLSCIHDAGSLQSEKGKLIGLYDARLLMDKLSESEFEKTASLSLDKGVSRIFVHYITRAAATFGDDRQKQMMTTLQEKLKPDQFELSAQLLNNNRSWLGDQYLDFRAVNGVAAKFGFIMNKLKRKIRTDNDI